MSLMATSSVYDESSIDFIFYNNPQTPPSGSSDTVYMYFRPTKGRVAEVCVYIYIYM